MGRAYTAGDYAGMQTGCYEFYYGYEHTICSTHGNDSDCECDDKEWAFVAKKNGVEVGRLTAKHLHCREGDCVEVLLAGIARFGDKFWRE